METLGEKLKAARIARKMSQNQAAEQLFVSRQSISKWENGVCLPDLDNFQKICELYQISPNEILADSPETLMPAAHGEPEPGEGNAENIDSLFFLIPFFFVYLLVKKKKGIFLFGTREKILVCANIAVTILILCFIWFAIPRTAVQTTR